MRLCPQHVVLVEVLVGNPAACIWHPGSGLMGWSVSLEQIALLHERGIRFVTLLLDGDDTGRRGRERMLPELSSSFSLSGRRCSPMGKNRHAAGTAAA